MHEITLYQKLMEHSASDDYPYHMPGHKRRLTGQMPKDIFDIDITEIDGFDNLHQAEGILKRAQERAALLYGADETFYLVGGSTSGVLSAISAVLPEGGHLLMTRNCHRCAYHAAYLRNLKISYLYPDFVEGYDIYEAITAGQVEEALTELEKPGNKSPVGAVLITSPTYEGRIADISKIAEVVHKRGIPLIVDEAHGAHLGLYKDWTSNSCQAGADLVVHSVHKTLPAMTQTALLHVNGELVDRNRLRRFLRIYQSSSPSYVLMASIQNALNQIETSGKILFRNFLQNWEEMLDHLSACKNLTILPRSDKQDIGKLVIFVHKTGLSGQQLYDMLLEEYHLQLEMASMNYALAMFTIGDTEEGFRRMEEALLSIDRRLDQRSEDMEVPPQRNLFQTASAMRAQKVLTLGQAWDMPGELRQIKKCLGEVAGEFINLYPPGVPLVVPGEILTEEILQMITASHEAGLTVQGIRMAGDDIYLQIVRCDQVIERK